MLVHEAACENRRTKPTCLRAELKASTHLRRRTEMTNMWNTLFLEVILILSASGAKAAGDNKTVDSKERAAKKACLVGNVEEGIGILADLYIDTNDPTFIYNQGRCFEQNGQNEQAVLRFKEYLRKAKKLKPADSNAIQKKIDDLQAGNHESNPVPAPAPAPQPIPLPNTALSAPSPTAAPPPPATVTVTAATVPPPDLPPASLNVSQTAELPNEPAPSSPVYKRWWFWTGIGVVIGGGVITALLLGNKSAATRSTCDVGVACAP
jgi:hypothetical protein